MRVGRNRIIFSVVMLIISLGLIWPGYVLFSHHSPLVFGFPLSFAWVILCTIMGFVAMLALFFSDHPPKKRD
nr:hypothetical protein [Saprospiraceae bacterium]